jgi:hypothetical protein
MSDLYLLSSDGHTPVLAESHEQWSRWHRENPEASQVKLDTIQIGQASYVIETRFWGSELNAARELNPQAPSHLFRTTAFHAGQVLFQEQNAATWQQAEQQHADVLERVRARASMALRASATGGSGGNQGAEAMPEEICIVQT